MCLYGNALFVAYSSGHIRVFKVVSESKTGSLKIEVTAHIRSISGIICNRENSILVSCSEDQLVSVWSIPDFIYKFENEFSLITSEKIKNCFLTGVCFIDNKTIAVAGYDSDELYKFEYCAK